MGKKTDAGQGATSPLKAEFLPGFEATDQEIDDILAFLNSLTDDGFLSNPAFSDPWVE